MVGEGGSLGEWVLILDQEMLVRVSNSCSLVDVMLRGWDIDGKGVTVEWCEGSGIVRQRRRNG